MSADFLNKCLNVEVSNPVVRTWSLSLWGEFDIVINYDGYEYFGYVLNTLMPILVKGYWSVESAKQALILELEDSGLIATEE